MMKKWSLAKEPPPKQNLPLLVFLKMFAPRTLSKTTNAFNQTFTRNFHASTANMAIKTYFDCQWTGPKLTCDMNGKVTSRDDAQARRLPLHSPSSTWRQTAINCHRQTKLT